MEVASKKENVKRQSLITGLLGCWLIASAAFSQDFPQPRGYVNDFANLISSNQAAQIEAICRELEEKTGAELAVVIMESIGDEDYVDYANRLFEKWGIGKKGRDNGVLLFLTLRERKVRIETGYGLEGILPDITAGRILDNYVVPELRHGDYGAGLLSGTRAIAGLVAADAGIEITGAVRPNVGRRRSSREGGFPIGWLLPLLIFLFLARSRWFWPMLFLGGLGSGRGRRRDWGGGFGGGFGGGGFGGFGGGSSGGGGAGRSF
jgi:uncharacterized protein